MPSTLNYKGRKHDIPLNNTIYCIFECKIIIIDVIQDYYYYNVHILD